MKKLILLILTVIVLSSVISQAKPMPDFVDVWPSPVFNITCKKCLIQVHIRKIKTTSSVKSRLSKKGKQKHTVNFKKGVSK